MRRALVLGGGGPVGIAWEAGLLSGLAQRGVELGAADFILGTSAGSFVGAQLALGRSPAELAAAIIAQEQRTAQSGGSRAAAPARPADPTLLFRKMQELAGGGRDPKEVRREIGSFSLASHTMDEEAFIASFGRRFGSLAPDAWPNRNFACTAVDAESGEFVVWDAAAKVGVVRAVASSCSVPGVYPAVTIKGRRYIDGGMRSSVNADVAKGYDLAVVVALRTSVDDERTRRLRMALDRELASLSEAGSRVELIVPDAASREAFGVNLMNFHRRPAAARAGEAQGKALAARLAPIWDA